MNAIQFLINDHNKARSMFADIAEGSHREQTKKKLFDELCHTLIIHETMEQTVWYPFLNKQDTNLKEIITHLIGEEEQASKEIKKVLHMDFTSDWQEKFLEIKKSVEHHANEEETKLFPSVEKILDQSTLERLGKEMYAFKIELKKAA